MDPKSHLWPGPPCYNAISKQAKNPNPGRKTLKPNPSTLNPKPWPSTVKPKPYKPSTPNPNSQPACGSSPNSTTISRLGSTSSCMSWFKIEGIGFRDLVSRGITWVVIWIMGEISILTNKVLLVSKKSGLGTKGWAFMG